MAGMNHIYFTIFILNYTELVLLFFFFVELESGMVMYDVLSGKEIFVQCPVLCVACDNARALEICHHLGSTAKHFC